MNLTTRKLNENDIDEVAKVFMVTFNATGETWTFDSSKSHILENVDYDSSFCALDDNDITGILISRKSTVENNNFLYVDTIAVLPEYQKNNIGTLLWNELEKFISDRKLDGVHLLANKNLISYEWYKRLGFSESGWVELYKITKSLDS